MRRLYRRAGRSQGSRRRAKRKTGYHGEVHGSIQPPERFSPGNAGIRDAGHQEKEIKSVHKYEVPAIIMYDILDGNKEIFDWMEKEII